MSAPASVDQGLVYCTRDYLRHRPLPSPIAPVAAALFTLLGASGAAGASARSAFVFTGNATPDAVKDLMLATSGPRVVVAQGTHPPPPLPRDPSTQRTPTTFVQYVPGDAGAIDGADAIYISIALHRALCDAVDSGDEEESRALKLFVAASLAHETAHWVAFHTGQGLVQGAEKRDNASGIFEHQVACPMPNPRDFGVRAVDALWGHLYSLCTYADGSHQLVSTSLPPALRAGHMTPHSPTLPQPSPRNLAFASTPSPTSPSAHDCRLSIKTQMQLVGGKLPATLDVTQMREAGQLRVGQKVPWKIEKEYLLSNVMETGSFCQH